MIRGHPMTDRRTRRGARKRTVILGVMALLVAGFCWRNWATLRNLPNPWTKLTVLPIRGGAYWVKGGVSNTGFIVGDKGVIVIDTQMFQVTARTALADISKVTPKPVNVVILTHSDPDHINGLPAYPKSIPVFAQVNTRDRIAAKLAHPGLSPFAPPGAIRDHMPDHLIDRDADVVLDGVPLRLIHVGPAHTDGDLVIYLPSQRVVYAGDVLTPAVGPYPGIHIDEGGSSLGWIRFMESLLALDADIYISGHGAPMTKAELRMRLATGVERRAQIAALAARGLDAGQIAKALHEPKPTRAAAMFPTFTQDVVEELCQANGTCR